MLRQLFQWVRRAPRGAQRDNAFERAGELYAQRRFSEAAAICAEIVAATPESATAWHLEALCRLNLDDKNAAHALMQSALACAPDDADMHMSMALICRQLGLNEQIIKHCRTALSLRAGFPAALVTLAQTLDRTGDYDGAIALYEEAVALLPDLREIHERLFALYHEQARNAKSSALIGLMVKNRPDDGLRIRAALQVPGFCESAEEIQALRARLAQQVDALLEQGPLQVADPVREIAVTPFYLAYHGMNDRDLMTSFARLVKKAYPGRMMKPRHCRDTGRIRIGFVSHYFFSHSVGRLSRGLIENLPRDRFEVTVYALENRSDTLADAIRSAADHYVDCSKSTLSETEAIISQQEQDLLFYTDIGMDAKSYFLAFSRLAPVQCATWGHPDTTGIDTIDHFISAADIETGDSAAHYSENLVRLKSYFLQDYAKPARPPSIRSREHFGIAAGRNIYLCPQSLFKLHPDFDAAMAQILRNDPNGEIILLEGLHRQWGERVRRRFARSLPDVAARVRFMPRMDWNDLLSLTANADVVLDTFHFGGGNTTYEALAMGTPVVTLPAKYLRGRFTLGCYRQMGYSDCIAETPDDFVVRANRLAMDKVWRVHATQQIDASIDSLFNQRESIAELARFFEEVHAAAKS